MSSNKQQKVVDTCQQLVDELEAEAAVLCPSLLPRGYDLCDLRKLADLEGPEESAALTRLLRGAASTTGECFVSGVPGRAQAEGSSGGEADSALHFTTFWTLDFPTKTLKLLRGGFVSEQVSRLHNTDQHLSLLCSPSKGGPSQAKESHALLCQLNGRDGSTADLWAQEVYSRAFSIKVLASSVRAWALEGPDGAAVTKGAKGTACALAAAALAAQSSPLQPTTPGKKRKVLAPGLKAVKSGKSKTPAKAKVVEGAAPKKLRKSAA